jgi:thioredoxin 1
MSSNVLHVSDAGFDQAVIQSTLPVLVDFWAAWCGPCKMIAPVLDEISIEYAGKVVIAKVDIDQNDQSPAQFGVRNIPTLMLFKQGQLVATQVGALSKTQLAAFIDQHI